MSVLKATNDVLALSRSFWWETNRGTRFKASAWLVAAVFIMNIRSRVALWASQLRSRQLNDLVALTQGSGKHGSKIAWAASLTLVRLIFASSLNSPLQKLSLRIRRHLRHQWVTHLTRHLLGNFVEAQCLHLGSSPGCVDPAAQPDQRISEDIDKFVNLAISLSLDAIEAIIHLKTFLVELLRISPWLTICAIAGAATSTSVTACFSRRLEDLYCEERRAAGAFTYTLTRLRENAESIAFYGGQRNEVASAERKLHERQRAEWRRLGLKDIVQAFTSSYQSILRSLPMVALPLYGKATQDHGHSHHGHGHSHGDNDAPSQSHGNQMVGNVAGASQAFAEVLEHFSILSNNTSDFTRLAAVARELSQLQENDALLNQKPYRPSSQMTPTPLLSDSSAHGFVDDGKAREENGGWLQLSNASVVLPDGRMIVKQLSCMAPPQGGLLVGGASGVGKTSLLRAIAGLWPLASGSIQLRAKPREIMFLPQKPYLKLGTLRDQLLYPFEEETCQHSDSELIEVLEQVGMKHVLSMCGNSFSEERCWSEELSVGEQQRVAFARVLVHRPKYVFLDEATSACDLNTEAKLYKSMKDVCTAWVSVGHRKSIESFHLHMLELRLDLTHELRSIS